MENFGEGSSLLVNELKQGREMAKQVKNHLNAPFCSSNESIEILVDKIMYSFEKAILMVNGGGGSSSSIGELQPVAGIVGAAATAVDSPLCLSESPISEDSDRDFKDQEHNRSDFCKKRKSMPRWTQQVRVSPGTGLEGPLDDGFSWRKYGQKDILGAKYPRGYYRCTHRHAQNCQATKQVQRSDEDPTMFQITYRGNHTCHQSSSKSVPPEEPEQIKDQTPLFNLKKNLTVETRNMDRMIPQQHPFPSFHHQNDIVFPNCTVGNNLTGGNISPCFGNKYFSTSPSGINNNNKSNYYYIQGSSESDMTEILSAATSAANSPTIGLDLPFGNFEFDPNFTFESSGLFSSFQPFEK